LCDRRRTDSADEPTHLPAEKLWCAASEDPERSPHRRGRPAAVRWRSVRRCGRAAGRALPAICSRPMPPNSLDTFLFGGREMGIMSLIRRRRLDIRPCFGYIQETSTYEHAPFAAGTVPLLEQCCGATRPGQWRPRTVSDLNHDLSDCYGLPVEFHSKIGALQTVSRVLNLAICFMRRSQHYICRFLTRSR
jgi:hypothetical protein